MLLAPEICERARRKRDARFDGRFFIGVKTTGIYCRPICPAPTANERNVLYFASAAAAHEAGFRPCLRCRPEAAPGSPAWLGTESSVRRALRMIEDGALDEGSVEGLAARLGMGERHLRRLFLEHLGATLLSVARTRRVHTAKSLLDQTALPMTEIALAAGFGSVRQFNTTIRDVYGVPPRELRGTRQRTKDRDAFELRIPYREPFDWNGMRDFFAARAIPGVEVVDAESYRRTFSIDGAIGTLEVRAPQSDRTIPARVRCTNPRVLPIIATRLRRQFDLTTDPGEVRKHLRRDMFLAPACRKWPGVRVPGAFDGFEVAVRGILGQQVTVAFATTISGRFVERFGAKLDLPESPNMVFPTAAVLVCADLTGIGMPAARQHAVRELARAVDAGTIVLDGTADVHETVRRLCELPGIGAWTGTYIAMRALGDPDAFPAGDLGLRKALRPGEIVAATELQERAESWRPWRAYAAALLWKSLNNVSGG